MNEKKKENKNHRSHLPNQKSHSLYQPPSSVYDEDPGIMSEVETSATGFRRASKSEVEPAHCPDTFKKRKSGLWVMMGKRKAMDKMMDDGPEKSNGHDD
ncbi:hypothetical protein CEXT_110251 [Caerostris extrusa]|uniref:Uncharacterized protein n=1 Tax=Caerostris extrusa TaxID=172846 RepID=A0AAV4RKG7_CAEEX|nr:hypothetical protein CEXT_110251 [Caerostris extrusa]